MEENEQVSDQSTDYGTVKTVRLRDEDLKRLNALKRALGGSEAAVIRQALRELSRAQGLESKGYPS